LLVKVFEGLLVGGLGDGGWVFEDSGVLVDFILLLGLVVAPT
jgi:hypothetical protein